MIYAQPGSTFEAFLHGAPTGLVGTLTYRLVDDDGTVHTAQSTAGITEPITGVYRREGLAPSTRGTYLVVWSHGTTTVAEELVVTSTLPGAPAAPPTGYYTTVSDLRLALAPSGDAGPATAASLSDTELADALSEAQQEIDARIGDQYGTPFADGSVPPLVAQVTRDLAAFKATLVHRRGNPLDSRDPVWLRYEHALGLLRQIGKGEVDLPGVADTAGSGEAAVVNPYEGQLFGLADFGLGVRP